MEFQINIFLSSQGPRRQGVQGVHGPPTFWGTKEIFLDHIDKIWGTQKIGKNS